MPVDSHRHQKQWRRDADGEFRPHDKHSARTLTDDFSVERDADEEQRAEDSLAILALGHLKTVHQDPRGFSCAEDD